ncbi:HotDog domain-containing protein [Powellomyces hirtus]|nr:HotDog domain-containing protein [Powellomyces hirtus]
MPSSPDVPSLQTILSHLSSDTAGFGASTLSTLTVIPAPPTHPPASVCFSFTVTPEMLNPFGALHGGCAALLVDATTTLALLAHGSPAAGSSIDLNVQYLAAAHQDDELHIVATVEKRGRNLAFTRCTGTRLSDGKDVFVGRHVKFLAAPKL